VKQATVAPSRATEAIAPSSDAAPMPTTATATSSMRIDPMSVWPMPSTAARPVDDVIDLPGDAITDYREALLARFSNPRMRDQLARIAADGSVKLPVRILPTVRAERAAGRVPLGGATTLAAWVLHLRGLGAPVKDPGAAPALDAANSGDLAVAVPAVLETLDPGLGGDAALVDAVLERAHALTAKSG